MIFLAGSSTVNSFVVFLAILLLVFPILFIRSLLKGWRPVSSGGLFWKALLIFSSPFYVGVVVIKVLAATGIISKEFGQMFPSLQNPTGKLPTIPEGTINFWSEFTVSLMAAAMLSGFAAVIIYSIFKSQPKSRKKIGGIVFWVALYASAIIIANGVFDRIQGVNLVATVQKEVQQTENRKVGEEEGAKTKGLYGMIRELSLPPEADEKTFDEKFRETKEAGEREQGAMAADVPDTVITNFLRLASYQVNALAREDRLACYYFFHTGTYLRRFKGVFSEVSASPEKQALLENLERQIRAPSTTKVTPGMSPREFAETKTGLFEKIKGTLPENDQNFNVFDNPQQVVTPDQKAGGCLTYLAYIDQVSEMAPDDAIRFYRRALEERGEAINALDLLNPAPALLDLYYQLVPEDGALAILFRDNPNLKKDFVFFLLENYEGDLEKLRTLALGRKKELLDENLRFYFYLASDEALAGHAVFHSNFMKTLKDQNTRLCGRFGEVLEISPVQGLSTRFFLNHEKALAQVMLSSRTSRKEFPEILEGDALEDALDELSSEMTRSLIGERPDIDILLGEKNRQTPAELLKACRQGNAFYSALARWPRAKRAAFLRGLLFEKTPN